MRLRLVHTLSLLLIALIFTAVLSFGGLLAWNLRSGFNDYLVARDTERLQQFAALVAAQLQASGFSGALKESSLDMDTLLREYSVQQGLPAPPSRGGQRGFPPPGSPGSQGARGTPPPGPGGQPPPGPEGFAFQVSIYALDGRRLVGPPTPPDNTPVLERPITVAGTIVGTARMPALTPVPDAVEGAFLQRQLLGIVLLGCALLVLSLVAARWLAGRWVRPLLGVQAATARMARGEFDQRLSAGRSDEIGDLIANVNQMADGLQRLEGARRRWIADISHELRTPLTVLSGELDALADGVRRLDAPAVTSLREETARLAALVDDLHLLAMSDLNALRCCLVACDAVEILCGCQRRFAQRAASAGIALELDLPSEQAIAVHWDVQRINQILANLLENSFRYTDKGGRILLTLRREPAMVRIQVDDTEPAVPTAELARLFEPLHRAEAARDRHRGGSGLGLAICAALVRAHGGTITAEHSVLGGLSVRLSLPTGAAPST